MNIVNSILLYSVFIEKFIGAQTPLVTLEALVTILLIWACPLKQRILQDIVILNLHYLLLLTEIDECVSTPCQNGGTCLDLVDFYNCTCLAGYNGTNCEIGE